MEMTTEELAKRVFPKKVRDKLKQVAYEKDGKMFNKEGFNATRNLLWCV